MQTKEKTEVQRKEKTDAEGKLNQQIENNQKVHVKSKSIHKNLNHPVSNAKHMNDSPVQTC